MFSRKEIMIFIMAFMIGLSLAWSCRLQAADNSTAKNIYPNYLLYNSTNSCVRGIVNLMISMNPTLAQQPVPPAVHQQMIGHCSCVMDKIRNELTIQEYFAQMHDYQWLKDIWGKHGQSCFDDGYLNGMGIKPKKPLKEMKIPEDNATPVKIPEYVKGMLPNLS